VRFAPARLRLRVPRVLRDRPAVWAVLLTSDALQEE
jgi:hypothetical protein